VKGMVSRIEGKYREVGGGMEVRITAGGDVERVHFYTLCRGFGTLNKIQ